MVMGMERSTVAPGIRRGRGAATNETGRYEAVRAEAFDDGWGPDEPGPPPLKTSVTEDRSRSVITRNDSPDVPFKQSINPYRGCEHGCAYCFARPTHAYLGFSPGLDFESRLFAKADAPEVLRRELRKPGYRCSTIAMGTNTDPYQPIEREWMITRGILEVLSECGHPVSIVTKSALVERDMDILSSMAKRRLAEVTLSVTTLNKDLARRLEPRAAAPWRRIQTLRALKENGVPCGVLVAPVIPGLTDSEMESILEECTNAGARWAGFQLLRLPMEVKGIFSEWLQANEPGKREHVLNLIRETRGGRLTDSDFGVRQTGTGPYAEMLRKRFHLACTRLHLNEAGDEIDITEFRPPGRAGDQMGLFQVSPSSNT
ncbi:MAG: PA0069 family radical SAM protein [Nitrospirae bacterium]|nr:PA0069 family radical SAM protein [Nitrospirota bacterium]